MKAKTKKMLMKVLCVLTFVGGLVHVLQPLNFDLLGFFQGFAPWVQLVAGVATVWYVTWMWMSKKKK